MKSAPILRFAVTGTLGFMVDGFLMLKISELLNVTHLHARALSFPIALSTTWLLNRYWTFEGGTARNPTFQFGLHLAGQLITMLINYGIFAALTLTVSFFAAQPLSALAMGAVCAASFSYLYAHYFSFSQPR